MNILKGNNINTVLKYSNEANIVLGRAGQNICREPRREMTLTSKEHPWGQSRRDLRRAQRKQRQRTLSARATQKTGCFH